MLKDKINTLYGNLNYEEISGNQGAVRCFHRVEGADHAYEIVWMLEERPTQEQFMDFAHQLSEIMNLPGNKRQRVVAADTTMLVDLGKFRLGAEVKTYSWFSLINDLFHSDHFCGKVMQDYSAYAALMTERIRTLSGSRRVDYHYIPQQVRSRNGADKGTDWDEFVAGSIISSTTTPSLFLVQAPAGYGKTSLSYEIARFVAERHMNDPSEPFPLFIPFAKYRRFGGVRDILRREIEEMKLYGGVNSQALLQLIHDGHAVVILDGFDELMAEMGKATAQASLAAIAEFMQGEARVLLTSRSAYLATRAEVVEMMDTRVAPEAVHVLELVPFDGAQQRQYLEQMGMEQSDVQRALDVIAKPNVHDLCQESVNAEHCSGPSLQR